MGDVGANGEPGDMGFPGQRGIPGKDGLSGWFLFLIYFKPYYTSHNIHLVSFS